MANSIRMLRSCNFLHANILSMTKYSTQGVQLEFTATYRNYPKPPSYKEIDLPEQRKLRLLLKSPTQLTNLKLPRYTRSLYLNRGLEEIHTDFLHGQYGVIALGGGELDWGHIEMIRNVIGSRMDTKKMFAVWRINNPWFPRVKRGIGVRMGGGKASVNRYTFPVKQNRVIVEMGGKVSFEEVLPTLRIVAANLPFKAEAISAEKLKEKRLIEKKIYAANQNKLTLKYLIQNNLLNCEDWIKPIDKIYYGKVV